MRDLHEEWNKRKLNRENVGKWISDDTPIVTVSNKGRLVRVNDCNFCNALLPTVNDCIVGASKHKTEYK